MSRVPKQGTQVVLKIELKIAKKKRESKHKIFLFK